MDQSTSYQIHYWNDKKEKAENATCYSAKPTAHGWCGTCSEDDIPGQEGFCDKFAPGRGRELGLVSSTVYTIKSFDNSSFTY
jgi:hypothetical protein